MNRIIRCALAVVFAITAAVAARSSAHATTEQWYSFDISCSNTNPANVATGAAQLFVRVSEGPGANQATFRFVNTGPSASSITDIYFDDGSLLGIASITDSGAGVDFSQLASPPNLPAGHDCTPDFDVTAGSWPIPILRRSQTELTLRLNTWTSRSVFRVGRRSTTSSPN